MIVGGGRGGGGAGRQRALLVERVEVRNRRKI